MFLIHRPSAAAIDRFLDHSRELPLSYTPIGLVDERPVGRRFDEQVVAIGHGAAAFERARGGLIAWKHFNLGWVEVFPSRPSIEIGAVVAVLIRHLGFWSLNGARVLYHVGDDAGRTSFGFAYGTLPNHAEGGEELFEVFLDAKSGDVMYRIRAVSWPQSVLAFVGQPIVRILQERFRRDSAAAMKSAAASP